ncbi:hypothetical protein THAOC_18246, partial [Thalassiosira oceanica]
MDSYASLTSGGNVCAQEVAGGVVVVEVVLPPALLPALDEPAHVRVLLPRDGFEPRLVHDLGDVAGRLLPHPGGSDRVGPRDRLGRRPDAAQDVAVARAVVLAGGACVPPRQLREGTRRTVRTGGRTPERPVPVPLGGERPLVRDVLEAAVALLPVGEALVLEEYVEEVGKVGRVGREAGRRRRAYAEGVGVVADEPDGGDVRQVRLGHAAESRRGRPLGRRA